MKHGLLEYQSLPPKQLFQIGVIQSSFFSHKHLLELFYRQNYVESKKTLYGPPFASYLGCW